MMERQTLSDNGQFDEPLLIEKMIALRIACPEGGYPQSEARYASIEE